MSVHNSEIYISSAIKSILNQTYKEFEFIIVNDGSTDRTLDIIKSFKDSRIKIINKKHSGLTKSLNLAIAQSKYNLLARQDADDFSYKRRLELQLTEFKKNERLCLVATRAKINFGNKKFLTPSYLNKNIKKLLKYKNIIIHPSVMIRKDFFKTINFYDEKYIVSQDYAAWSRLSSNVKYEFKILDNILINRHIEKESISLKKNFLQSKNSFVIRKNNINIFINFLLFIHQYLTNLIPINFKFYKK